jgi:hypothetical protein
VAEQMKHAAQVSQPAVLTFAAQTSSGGVTLQKPTTIDFAANAKAYKKSKTHSSLMRGLLIASILVIVIIALLGAVGFWVNSKYAGRALPLTYIGGTKVGGLNQVEIKAFLDKRAEEMTITLVDGGLTREVSPAEFSALFDTEAASKEAINEGFNPFAFLNRKNIEVPVSLNERQVAGYVDLNFATTQTQPYNATLVKGENGLEIRKELNGFTTDAKFIAKSLNYMLAGMTDPIINVNSVTLKPTITGADLEDDLKRANDMLNTNVSLEYTWAKFTPDYKQKLDWLVVSEVPGTTDIKLEFNEGAIRQYVVDMTKRLQPVSSTSDKEKEDEITDNQFKFNFINIDEVSSQITRSLTNATPTIARLKTDQ